MRFVYFWIFETGDLWQKFRDGRAPDPSSFGVRRSKELCDLVRLLMSPRPRHRRMAHEILEMAPVQAAKHDTFIVDVIRRSRQDDSKRRRIAGTRPMSSMSSRSFTHISSLAGSKTDGGSNGVGNGLSIRVPSFDAFSAVRDGMSTPTDQTFSHDYANPLPSFGTPTNKK